MANASTAIAKHDSSIIPAEAEHFGKLAADWWNPKGSSAMLHKLNPARLSYLREQIDAHWGTPPESYTPLAGRSAIDVGCGAGLLCEPLARLGARVTGIDAAHENITVARDHAAQMGLAINYRATAIEDIRDERFDLVTSMEVIEHVAEPAAFIASLAFVMADGGLMVLSTPNRTALSRLALITIGEGTGQIPRGTHDWRRFLTPDELGDIMSAAGLTVIDRRGLGFSPARGFTLTDDMALDYFVTAVAA